MQYYCFFTCLFFVLAVLLLDFSATSCQGDSVFSSLAAQATDQSLQQPEDQSASLAEPDQESDPTAPTKKAPAGRLHVNSVGDCEVMDEQGRQDEVDACAAKLNGTFNPASETSGGSVLAPGMTRVQDV